MLKVIERHELHNISSHVFAVSLRIKRLIVTIQSFHRLKVGITDTNDDNGERQFGASYDLINCFVHITNDTISNDHQDVELLVHLIDRFA